MRTIIRSFFIVLISASPIVLKAADPIFVVYYVKGKANKQGSQNSILKKGDHLLRTDKLQITGGEIVLICENFTPIKLQDKGIYTIANLLLLCKQSAKSTTSAYFRYVWNELTQPHGSPQKDPRNYMKTSGAVSRGYQAVEFISKVDTIHYAVGKLRLNWEPSGKIIKARVFDASEDGSLLLEKNLKAGSLPIDSIAEKLGAPGEYYWGLWDESDRESNRHYLKIWDRRKYKNAIANLVKYVGPSSTKAEKYYLRGFLFEENHFMTEASIYYKKAFHKEPDNPIYQQAYEAFSY